MKTFKSRLILFLLGLSLIALPGMTCSNTDAQKNTIYKSEGTIIATVDTSMRAWRDWVVAGHATQQQVDAVRQEYNRYKSAQDMVKMAVDAYYLKSDNMNSNNVVTFTSIVGDRGQSLLNLVASYMKPAK